MERQWKKFLNHVTIVVSVSVENEFSTIPKNDHCLQLLLSLFILLSLFWLVNIVSQLSGFQDRSFANESARAQKPF